MAATEWRQLGRMYGAFRLLRKTDLRIDRLLSAVMGLAVVHEVEQSIKEVSNDNGSLKESKRPGPPDVSDIQESNWQMPTEVPFPRNSRVWPTFTGLRYDIGGDKT